jgi:hypothetical protein
LKILQKIQSKKIQEHDNQRLRKARDSIYPKKLNIRKTVCDVMLPLEIERGITKK